MYRVILINLSTDARSVLPRSHLSLTEVDLQTLRDLLINFCAIDPIENANAGTEIRVQVRRESYLLNASNAKLVLYDMQHRELPGQIFSVEEVMKELDGSAASRRNQTIMRSRGQAVSLAVEPVASAAPLTPSGRRRLIILSVAIGLLLAANFMLWSFSDSTRPFSFVSAASDEIPRLQSSLAGVYLTGNEPGQHGVVIGSLGELKLFEIEAVQAPRVVYATYKLGRIGRRVCLATDQPGGLIEVMSESTLLYCGENYRRIQ